MVFTFRESVMGSSIQFMIACLFTLFITTLGNYNPFVDNILFSVNWPGQAGEMKQDLLTDERSVVMTTGANEKYRCIIPEMSADGSQDAQNTYQGPTPLDLLSPLFKQTACSYRIDPYWTYELCHGRHLRQYHEDREPGKKAKLQEYFLGHYKVAPEAQPKQGDAGEQVTKDGEESPSKEEDSVTEDKPQEADTSDDKKESKIKVDGVNMPFYEVVFTGGTPCDLTSQKRKTRIRYVCHDNGRGELFEIKETVTCEYDAIVLSSELCHHPDFREKKDPVNQIQCHPLEGAPKRPTSLDLLELENTEGGYHRNQDVDESHIIKNNVDEDKDDDDDIDEEDEPKRKTPGTEPKKEPVYVDKGQRPEVIGKAADKQLLRDFLAGTYCIRGGTGWWKHEFCYGRHVQQYHVEPRGEIKTRINLGVWNLESHLEWIQAHPSKKPKKHGDKRFLIQYYTMGDFCEETRRNRKVEVKLRCTNGDSNAHSIGIYLIEPATCEYQLVVESPIFCTLINQADEYGLLHDPEL